MTDAPTRTRLRAAMLPVGITAGPGAAAALRTGLIRLGAGESPQGRASTGRMEFSLWSALVGASFAMWVVVAAISGRLLRVRWRNGSGRPTKSALTGMVLGALVLLVGVYFALLVVLMRPPPIHPPWTEGGGSRCSR
ncbi:hypothetical protein, partial [Kitasatospora nipponensis]|uniref:hypothetical protein n=1 Tax=Kitasatospora nipponensis TaxID=258049 RepID=UPI0031D33D1E